MQNRHNKNYHLTKRLRFSILLSSISLVFGLAAPAVFPAKLSGYAILQRAAADTTDTLIINNSPLQTVDESKIDAAVQNVNVVTNIDVSKMDDTTKNKMEQVALVEAQKADLPTAEDTKDYQQTLVNMFDSTKDNYQNPEKSTQELVAAIDENHQDDPNISGQEVLAARHGLISVSFAGAAINFAISFALGGLVGGGIRMLIRKFGSEEAVKFIQRQIVGRLAIWKIKVATGITPIIHWIVYSVLDPGTSFARWLDSIDHIRNNGYLEF